MYKTGITRDNAGFAGIHIAAHELGHLYVSTVIIFTKIFEIRYLSSIF